MMIIYEETGHTLPDLRRIHLDIWQRQKRANVSRNTKNYIIKKFVYQSTDMRILKTKFVPGGLVYASACRLKDSPVKGGPASQAEYTGRQWNLQRSAHPRATYFYLSIYRIDI